MHIAIVGVIGSIIAAFIINFLSWYFHQPSTTWNNEYHKNKYKLYGSLENNIIMCIPGLDSAAAFFSDVIPELSAQGYSVLLMNLPLYLGGENYTFEYLSDEIVSVLDELNIKNVDCIVGESFGGVITQYIALNHPKKVKSMALLSSLAKTNVPKNVEWKVTYLLPILKLVGFVSPGFAQSLFARLHCEDVVEKTEDIAIKDLFIKEASVAHFASVMERIKIVYKLDIRERIKHEIKIPTLILYGSIHSVTYSLIHSLIEPLT
jgi:pimeloyl-ACP methyl ester carboxylesterase